jgi:hypothetical protein
LSVKSKARFLNKGNFDHNELDLENTGLEVEEDEHHPMMG